MQFWMEFFSIVAAIALVVQVGILIGLFLQLRKTTESINRMVTDLHTRMGPILTRTQIMLDDTQPKISALVATRGDAVTVTTEQAIGAWRAAVSEPVNEIPDHLQSASLSLMSADHVAGIAVPEHAVADHGPECTVCAALRDSADRTHGSGRWAPLISRTERPPV